MEKNCFDKYFSREFNIKIKKKKKKKEKLIGSYFIFFLREIIL